MKALKLFLITSFLSLVLCGQAQAVDAVVEKEIPSTSSMLYYSIGGGNLIPKPANFEVIDPYSVNFPGESHFSCGKFGMAFNVDKLLNNLSQYSDTLRFQLAGLAEAAIAAQPGYLLNKANPALYHTLNRSLDQAYELFQLNVRSCEQIEEDMIRSGSVFGGLVGATAAEGWREAAKTPDAEPIHETSKRVYDNAGNAGVAIFGATKKGGIGQDPIRLNYDTSLAGYNALTHPSGVTDPLQETAVTGKTTLTDVDGNTSSIDYPIISMWGSPKVAAEWIIDVVGEQHIKIAHDQADPAYTKSKAGRGLRPHIVKHTFDIRKALNDAVVNNKYAGIRDAKYSDIFQVGFPVVDAIRAANPYEQSLLMDRLSNELAVNFVLNQAGMAKRILYAGMREASLEMSSAGQEVTKVIRKHTMPNLNDSVDEVLKDVEIRESTLAKTPLKILRHASDIKTRGAGSETPNMAPDKPIVDGQVEK